MRRRRRCGTVARASVSSASLAVASDQRVAAGQDHLVDRWRRRAISSIGLAPAARGRGLLGVGEVAAEAVAAMHRAAAGGDQQRAAAVLAGCTPCAGARRGVADRVQAEARHRPHLRRPAAAPGAAAGRAGRRGACARRSRAAPAAGTARRPASDRRRRSASRPSRSSSSRGSRTASRHSCCQSRGRAVAAAGCAGRGAAGIMSDSVFRRAPARPAPARHSSRSPPRGVAQQHSLQELHHGQPGHERRQDRTEDPGQQRPVHHHRDRVRQAGQGPGLHPHQVPQHQVRPRGRNDHEGDRQRRSRPTWSTPTCSSSTPTASTGTS